MKRLHKMEMPKVEDILPAVFGSLGSAWFWLKGSRGRRVGLALFGVAASYYSIDYVSVAFGVDRGVVGFWLGVFCVSIVDSVFKTWQELGPIDAIRNTVRAVRGDKKDD